MLKRMLKTVICKVPVTGYPVKSREDLDYGAGELRVTHHVLITFTIISPKPGIPVKGERFSGSKSSLIFGV